MTVDLLTATTDTTPEAVAAAQLAAYNARDLDAFCALFSADVEVYDHPGQLVLKGAEAFRSRYAERFSAPGLRADLLHRMSVGKCAIDHERIWFKGPELSDPVEAVAIYTVREGLITRVDFIREGAPQ